MPSLKMCVTLYSVLFFFIVGIYSIFYSGVTAKKINVAEKHESEYYKKLREDELKEMRAALYVRVSTLEQATEGYSVGVQKEKLAAYANAQSYEVSGIYSDEGYSGKNLNRPEMRRLLNAVECGQVDVVLIYKLDRLSRRVRDVLELVELFGKYDVALYSLNENLDLSSPFGRAALKMSATFSELERETIVERMEMGKHARAVSGKYSCPGRPPFGYALNRESDRLDVVPEEAEIVREMFDKYIEGLSLRKLYAYCKSKYPNVRYFSCSTCCKPVIERPLYAGYFMHKGELIKAVNCDPIISYETYLLAQEAVRRNTTVREHDNTPYLLTGLLTCGKCGRAFCGKRRTHKRSGEVKYEYVSYGCEGRIKHEKGDPQSPCNNEIYSANELENLVGGAVRNLAVADSSALLKASAAVADRLLQENNELNKQKEKLLDLYLNEQIDRAVYAARYDELNKRIRNNIASVDSENSKVSREVRTECLRERILAYPTLSKKEKRKLLCLLINKITVLGNEISIEWKFY